MGVGLETERKCIERQDERQNEEEVKKGRTVHLALWFGAEEVESLLMMAFVDYSLTHPAGYISELFLSVLYIT